MHGSLQVLRHCGSDKGCSHEDDGLLNELNHEETHGKGQQKTIICLATPHTKIMYVVQSWKRVLVKGALWNEGLWVGNIDPSLEPVETGRFWEQSMLTKTDVKLVEFELVPMMEAIQNDPKMAQAADKMELNDLWGKMKAANTLTEKEQRISKERLSGLRSQLRERFGSETLYLLVQCVTSFSRSK